MRSPSVVRALLVLVTGLLVGLGSSSQAQAYQFVPVGTNFTASGDEDIVFGGSHTTCHVSFTGKTNATGSAATFINGTATGSPFCALVTFRNLPWTLTAIGPSSVQLTNVGYKLSTLPACGPGTVTGTLSGVFLNFNALLPPAGCAFVAGLATNPQLTIVP